MLIRHEAVFGVGIGYLSHISLLCNCPDEAIKKDLLLIVDNSTVTAGTVVTKNVLENTIVAGVPAKVIKKIDDK